MKNRENFVFVVVVVVVVIVVFCFRLPPKADKSFVIQAFRQWIEARGNCYASEGGEGGKTNEEGLSLVSSRVFARAIFLAPLLAI